MTAGRKIIYSVTAIGFISFIISIKLFNAYFGHGQYSPLTWITWLSSLMLLIGFTMVLQFKRLYTNPPGNGDSNQREFQPAILFILALATFIFRWSNIENLPYGFQGMHYDTAYNSELAFRILDGTVPFSPVLPSMIYVRDSLQHYYLAFFFLIFGKSIFALRISSVILSIINVLLLYTLSQTLLKRRWISLFVALLYACSSTDTVFSYSAFEHVISTPILVAAFILLHRAGKEENLIFYGLSGILVGLGCFSSYYFIILAWSFFIYFIHIFIFEHGRVRKQWQGWTLFVAGILVAAMPKFMYLLYKLDTYLIRIYEVSQSSRIPDFWGKLTQWKYQLLTALHLLFDQHAYSKWLLGENPLLDPIVSLLTILSIFIMLWRIRRPESVFLLGIIFLSVLINVFSNPMDYRFINVVPFFYISSGYVLSSLSNVWKEKAIPIFILLALVTISWNYASYQNVKNLGLTSYHYHYKAMFLQHLAHKTDNNKKIYYSIVEPNIIPSLFLTPHEAPRLHSITELYVFRGSQLSCNSIEPFYDIYNRIYQIFNKNQGNVKDLVLVFDDAMCNREIIRFIESQFYCDRRTHTFDFGKIYALTILENFSPHNKSLSSSEKKSDPHIKLGAIDFSPRQGSIGGINGVYSQTGLNISVERSDGPLDFNWTGRSPVQGISPNSHFSVIWHGYLYSPQSGFYELIVESDDGSRLWIDRNLVINDWTEHAVQEVKGKVFLEKGWHAIDLHYYNSFGQASIKLSWNKGEGKEIIPAEYFCCKGEVRLPEDYLLPLDYTVPDYTL